MANKLVYVIRTRYHCLFRRFLFVFLSSLSVTLCCASLCCVFECQDDVSPVCGAEVERRTGTTVATGT